MSWLGRKGECSTWNWYYPIPNGWTAAVHDHSQMYAPKKPTSYEVSAISRKWIVQGKGSYLTLEEAKRNAILLAMQQGDPEQPPKSHYQEILHTR